MKKTGAAHFFAAFGYSMKGFQAACFESAFRQELVFFCLLLPIAFWIGQSPIEIVLLLGVLLLVLIVELLNTAIESVVDRVGQEHHELSGRAKDLGSAAVMLTLLLAGAVWLAVIWSRFGG